MAGPVLCPPAPCSALTHLGAAPGHPGCPQEGKRAGAQCESQQRADPASGGLGHWGASWLPPPRFPGGSVEGELMTTPTFNAEPLHRHHTVSDDKAENAGHLP